MREKVVLAYSGGLDTTAIIPWLKETYDYDVVCCCIDCGQEEELDGLEERAKLSGASKLYIEDITDEFAEDYIVPCVMGSAVYEHKYLLGTSMARPGIAKKLVEIARKEKEAKKKQKVVEIKEVRLSPNIDENDLNTKASAARKFITKGNRVKVTLRFRGREMAHVQSSKVILDEFASRLSDIATVEKAPKMEGRSMSMFLTEKR